MAAASRAQARPEVASNALHPGAWLAWLAAVCADVFLTSNPLYLSLALLVALGVYVSVADTTKGRAMRPFVVLGLAFAALSIPFNVLTGSAGPTVLTTLPELTFPRWFGGVTLGGDVTAEALVTATSRALSIASLVVAAAAFNAAVDHFRLLRLAPRALAQLALSLTVAAVVIPQGVAHARAVAEAQRLRGRRARGLRALPSLLLPTLQGALERSVQRAESLDARGFGAGAGNGSAFGQVAGVAGLGVCLGGAFTHFYYGPSIASSAAMAAGVALVAGALLRAGALRTSRYRIDRWTLVDTVVAAAAAASLLLIVALRVAGAGDVSYLAYPEVVAPGFHAAGAAAFLLLLVPALHAAASRPEAKL